MFFSKKKVEKTANEERWDEYTRMLEAGEFDPDPSWTNEAFVIFHCDRIYVDQERRHMVIKLDHDTERTRAAEFEEYPNARPGASMLMVFKVPDGYEVAMGNDGHNHLYDPYGSPCTVTKEFFSCCGLTVSSPNGVFNSSAPRDRRFYIQSYAPSGTCIDVDRCEFSSDPETGEAWVSLPGYMSPGLKRHLAAHPELCHGRHGAAEGGAPDTSRKLPARHA